MTEQQFLESILADPESDAPRLVYADWLTEQGDPRGEFIRVQCEIAAGGEDECGGFELRQLELLETYGAEWRKPAWRLGCADPRFERGFLHQVSIDVDSLSRNDLLLTATAPLLDVVELESVADERSQSWAICFHTRTLSRVGTLIVRDSRGSVETPLDSGLFFRSMFDDGGTVAPYADQHQVVEHLLGAASNLVCHTLILNRFYFADGDIVRLARHGHELRGLKQLRVGGNYLGDDDADRLVESRLFHQLELLDLRQNQLSDVMREELQDRFGTRVLV